VPDQDLEIGDEVAVDIEAVAHGGHFVARHAGRVLFVRHAAPGERVVARITGTGPGGRFLYADAVAIERPSPGRVTPPCRYAGVCGGCDFQHLTLAAQRDLLSAVVREQFARLAGLEVDVEVQELGEAEPGLGWRTRVEFAVGRDGRAGLHPHRSHDVVRVTDCLIAAPGVVETGVLDQLWPSCPSVEVTAPSTGEPVVTPVPAWERGDARSAAVPAAATVAAAEAAAGGAEAMAAEAAPGETVVRERVTTEWVTQADQARAFSHEFALAARGFWQVHPRAAATFVARVLAELDPQPGERALDLYAGVGLFAAALADAVGPEGQVLALESDRLATTFAVDNLASWPQALVVPGRVDDLFGVARPGRRGPAANRATRNRKPRRSPLVPHTADLVVLDPPRTGAGAQVVRAIAALRPRAVAYVACDPAALARDTAAFGKAGYALTGLTAYDAFPMTHHVECIATFRPVPTGEVGGSTDQQV
jgi:tRNA/tmRNA/rRNA uracil-C5-methylase (TrmA/RlmC/RlmD family)